MLTTEQAFGVIYDLLLTHPIKSAFRAADDGPEGEPPPVDEEMLVAVQAHRFALMVAVRELRASGEAVSPKDLDPAGVPKLPLTALEQLAIDACNRVKAWAESDRSTPFPEEAHMLCDGVLMMAAQRRKGVQ